MGEPVETAQLTQERRIDARVLELADAHCHLDLIGDAGIVRSDVARGVRTIVTDGVDTKSNMRAMELADGKNIFAAVGIDPEHALTSSGEELEFNLGIIRSNRLRITAIGEIGLDYKAARTNLDVERQKVVFGRLLEAACDAGLPVSVHARGALDDALAMLRERGVERAQLHYFEGDEKHAKLLERYGYMISVPPLESGRRMRAIRALPIDQIMTESDSPVVGPSPISVARSVEIVARAKGIEMEEAARETVANAKRFFGISL